jgi:DNA-binding GntR family transcriptional regulator
MTDTKLDYPSRIDDGAGKGVPLYYQVFLLLRNDIMSGVYKPGDALPGEHVL